MSVFSNSSGIRTRVQIPLLELGTTPEFFTFKNLPESAEHIALGFGDWQAQESPLVRVHSECLTGDLFGSARCDCGPQLQECLRLLSEQGGILIYMRQEGRGIGLYNKLETYVLQSQGLDTYEANSALSFADDVRDYASAASILKAMGKERIQLITNNPDKKQQLEKNGVRVVGLRPTSTFLNPHNRNYLFAKQIKTKHALESL